MIFSAHSSDTCQDLLVDIIKLACAACIYLVNDVVLGLLELMCGHYNDDILCAVCSVSICLILIYSVRIAFSYFYYQFE